MMFACEDLERLTDQVVEAWRSGIGGDWSVPAGTLEWTCAKTADHAVDTVLAPALFLASRKLDGYPGFRVGSAGPDPVDLVEGLQTASRILAAVVKSAPPDTRATIWPGAVRGPVDFVPRGALELILHAHDVCAGLAVPFRPDKDLCEQLRQHTRSWPMWGSRGWSALSMTGDPLADLLRASGRIDSGA